MRCDENRQALQDLHQLLVNVKAETEAMTIEVYGQVWVTDTHLEIWQGQPSLIEDPMVTFPLARVKVQPPVGGDLRWRIMHDGQEIASLNEERIYAA